ncbi:hypothetical protein NUACC21_06520 [Scytonema sp. NUACC21]
MALRLGDTVPNFTQASSEGDIDFYTWAGDSWVVLFSHPADYTPVCTTELGQVAKLKPEFDKRNVKTIALSVDDVESHKGWIGDIEETQNATLNYPILADADRKVSDLYDMIHPNANASLTVRTVFIIDPNKKLRLTLTYPPSTGRNFDEILRVIDSLQLTDNYSVATPADWKDGDDCVIVPSLKDPEVLKEKFPKGYQEVKPYLRMTPQPITLSRNCLHIREVPAQHLGLLYINQEFQTQLQPGMHAWWIFGRSFQTEVFDLRYSTMEVSGQDILSKDKVPLRLNLTAGYRILDPLRAKNGLSDITTYLYKELQFGLRGAVGERTLDALLEDKGAIDRSVSEYIRQKTADYGIEVDSVGVKDIILPGEIKTILSKVVEAEKAAQANVVRRREETAATRSMLNTAKVMEDNPVALRLKELEVLERIAEKIEKIQVNGSLDSILTELIRINR